MRKYYCPYCGEPSFKWYHKYLSRNVRLNIFHQFLCCKKCDKKTYLKSHQTIWILLFVLLAVVFVLYFFESFLLEFPIFAMILLTVSFALLIAESLLHIFLSKIIRDKTQVPDKFYKATIIMDERIKYPKLYFCGTSVVILNFKDTNELLPIIIEPIAFNDRDCNCRITFIKNDNMGDLCGEKFILTDNAKTVAIGSFNQR